VQQLVMEATAVLQVMKEVQVAEAVEVEGSHTPVVMVVDPLEAVVDLEDRAGFKISGMEGYPAFGYLGQDRRRTGTMIWLGERSRGRFKLNMRWGYAALCICSLLLSLHLLSQGLYCSQVVTGDPGTIHIRTKLAESPSHLIA
jgi:hypothetical protein